MAVAAVVEPSSGLLSPSFRECQGKVLDVGPELSLTLLVQRPNPKTEESKCAIETLQVFPDETIRDVKLRLKNRGWWFHRGCCVVLGDRELLEHERVSEVVKSNDEHNHGYLHVFAKLGDVQSVQLSTPSRHLRMTSTDSNKSLLTAALEEQDAGSPMSLVRSGSQPFLKQDDTTVVHLLIRKSAKVSWRHMEEDQFQLEISSSDTAETVKRKVEAVHSEFSADEHELVYGGKVINSSTPLASCVPDLETAVFELQPLEPSHMSQFPDGSPLLSSPKHELYANWQQARAGLAEGHVPKLASAGSGGSYFLEGVDGKNVAVFKPQDEEPLAVNNPRGLSNSPTGQGLRKGTVPGEGAVREVAAYLLDHGGFAGVPPTAMVSLGVPGDGSRPAGEKVGSLQQFVTADTDCEERGPSAFPVPEVHKICVLDIRLANTDRNGSNILARQHNCSWQLIPIDHGYCLPTSFEDITFEWLYWPQARVPFDPKTLKYIENLDPERDVATLEGHNIFLRPDSIKVLTVTTHLLKKAAARALTPYQIGCIMSRQGMQKSPLEKLHHNALQQVKARQGKAAPMTISVSQDALYYKCIFELMDEYLDEFLLDSLNDTF